MSMVKGGGCKETDKGVFWGDKTDSSLNYNVITHRHTTHTRVYYIRTHTHPECIHRSN